VPALLQDHGLRARQVEQEEEPIEREDRGHGPEDERDYEQASRGGHDGHRPEDQGDLVEAAREVEVAILPLGMVADVLEVLGLRQQLFLALALERVGGVLRIGLGLVAVRGGLVARDLALDVLARGLAQRGPLRELQSL
jgi:hypothetical protein